MRATSVHLPHSLVTAISLPTDSTIDILKKIVLLGGNLGGFKASGVVFIWVAACAIMAIITGQYRQAVLWIVLFLLFTGLFAFIEPSFDGSNTKEPEKLSILLFAL